MRILLGIVAAILSAWPCLAATVEVVLPPPFEAHPLPAGAAVKPVSLTRIAANIAPGTPWAAESVVEGAIVLTCALSQPEVSLWKETNNQITEIETWDRVVRKELAAAGARTNGDPTNLFEETKASDLQLGALITDLRLKTCVHRTMAGTSMGGSAVMSVEWQVFSVTQGKVVARISTRGGATLKQTKDATPLSLLTGAFGDNVKRLSADGTFQRIILGAPEPAAAATTITFKTSELASVPLKSAVKSVVSIYAGESLGSGVVISPEGYILTNHHVAGSDGRVRVRWPDGSDTVGEVVRGDRRRDVSLIKTSPMAAPLPMRHGPVDIGETVYAVGTPLGKEFAGTLTRGIISAHRVQDGQPVLQSDVAVDHGNSGGPLLDEQGRIVALTVSRYEPDDVSHDINFFIPIEDALRALALKPAA